MSSRTCLLALAATALLAVPAAAADAPTLLGVSGAWTAASTGVGDAKVCFAMAHPKSSIPSNVKRDPIGFLISDWPARKTNSEPEVVAGYPYKDGSSVTATIGSQTFTFFVKNDGTAGSAWMKDPAEEVRLVTAMKGGATMIVSGTSRRGTLTRDNYTLAGIAAALDKIHTACGS